jgi:hypothetical protein
VGFIRWRLPESQNWRWKSTIKNSVAFLMHSFHRSISSLTRYDAYLHVIARSQSYVNSTLLHSLATLWFQLWIYGIRKTTLGIDINISSKFGCIYLGNILREINSITHSNSDINDCFEIFEHIGTKLMC